MGSVALNDDGTLACVMTSLGSTTSFNLIVLDRTSSGWSLKYNQQFGGFTEISVSGTTKIVPSNPQLTDPLFFCSFPKQDGGTVYAYSIGSSSASLFTSIVNPEITIDDYGIDFDVDTSPCMQFLYVGSPERDSTGFVYVYQFNGVDTFQQVSGLSQVDSQFLGLTVACTPTSNRLVVPFVQSSVRKIATYDSS